jgi:hypothetical protein
MITINVIKVNEVEYLTGKLERRLLSRILKRPKRCFIGRC